MSSNHHQDSVMEVVRCAQETSYSRGGRQAHPGTNCGGDAWAGNPLAGHAAGVRRWPVSTPPRRASAAAAVCRGAAALMSALPVWNGSLRRAGGRR